MDKSDLEVSVTPRIREAIQAAVDQTGKKRLASTGGLDPDKLDLLLASEEPYIPMATVSAACLINRTRGDPDPNHSSVSECLKGATIRLPPRPGTTTSPTKVSQPILPSLSKPKRPVSLMDQKSVKLINFGGNTISFFLLGYFLGGIVLSPLFGLPSCIGVSFSPPAASPCLGSIAGLVVGAIAGLGYTVYFFIKKM